MDSARPDGWATYFETKSQPVVSITSFAHLIFMCNAVVGGKQWFGNGLAPEEQGK
jgi:hypothetical protein